MNKILLIASVFAASLLSPVWAQGEDPYQPANIVSIDGQNFYVHTVKLGETFFSLSQIYSVPQGEILKYNPHTVVGLKQDQVLKIPVVAERKQLSKKQQNKLFDIHIVNKGETAYAISRRYGISIGTLVEDNQGLDPGNIKLGEELNIRKKSIGEHDAHQIREGWEDYRDALNSVSNEFAYYLVERGETLYSLSKKYDVSQEEILTNNDLSEGLKAGSMVKIPLKEPKHKVDPAAQHDVTHLIIKPIEQTPPSRQYGDDGLYEGADIDSMLLQPDRGERVIYAEGPAVDSLEKDNIEIKALPHGTTIDIAMFLPLRGGNTSNRSFMEFYEGALLALEDLKPQGVVVRLNLYNTEKSEYEVREIVESREFQRTNLIIGPVYEDVAKPAVEFAEKYAIPIISPLAPLKTVCSSVVYQMAPSPASKYVKLKEYLEGDKNIVVISSATDDPEFEKEIIPVLPEGYRRFDYTKDVSAATVTSLIKTDKDNVFVVLSSNEVGVDEILARISSVQNSIVTRSVRTPSVTVVGNSRWQRFNNIDRNLYFKLKLCYVSSYHADRTNELTLNFDKRYIGAFSSIPTLYSYRGYDVVKLFVSAIADSTERPFVKKVNDADQNIELLQMPYLFKQEKSGYNYENQEWALVKYNDDYTIEVK